MQRARRRRRRAHMYSQPSTPAGFCGPIIGCSTRYQSQRSRRSERCARRRDSIQSVLPGAARETAALLRTSRELVVWSFLEASSLQGRCLRVADGRLDLSLKIRRIRAAWQRHNAVVFKRLRIQCVDLRVVNVGLDHALFEVVEPDRVRRTAEIGKPLFVKLRGHRRL